MTFERILRDASENAWSLYAFGDVTLPGGARNRYVNLSIHDDGDVIAAMSDRTTGQCEVWDATGAEMAAIARMREFLS